MTNSDQPCEPERACTLCPRLAAFRDDWRRREPDWFNGPVPIFGPADARLLIVGLAPGLRGANRTGRPFTGDYAGDLLYETMIAYGFARGSYGADPGDGLERVDAAIVNAVRDSLDDGKATARTVPAVTALVADLARGVRTARP